MCTSQVHPVLFGATAVRLRSIAGVSRLVGVSVTAPQLATHHLNIGLDSIDRCYCVYT